MNNTQKAWIKALRSGEYHQATGSLRQTLRLEDPFETKNVAGYCCLGVACEVSSLGRWTGAGYLLAGSALTQGGTLTADSRLYQRLGLGQIVINPASERVRPLQDVLINLNDDEEWNFEQIADFLEDLWTRKETT